MASRSPRLMKSEGDEVIAETAAGNLLLLKNCFELLLGNDAFG